MFILNLQASNYRNYAQASLELGKGPNIFVGENAQGKSNLLEAIYLLSTLRSSRASSDSDLVRKDILDSDFPVARLTSEVQRAAGRLSLEIAIVGRSAEGRRAGKRTRVNGIEKRASEAVGQFSAVLFTTNDLEVVAGPPMLRRRYLDMMISQVDRGYLRAMQRYARVLQQRNGLLKRTQQREADPAELGFWNQELTHAGGIIMRTRAEALGVLVPEAVDRMLRLSNQVEALRVTYKPALGASVENSFPIDEAEWSSRFLQALDLVRERELRQATTVVGPHRDDFTVEINEMDAGSFASRAQLRTAALALRLAEAAYLQRMLGDDPVVLLDDVLSEMDARRRHVVLDYVHKFEQTIVTTADPDQVRDIMTNAAGRFVVSAGTVTPFEGE